MKKETLISFIDKYSLGGTIDKVNWKIITTEKILKARGELQAKTFTADITLSGFDEIAEVDKDGKPIDLRIPIANTQKIRSMLAPFSEDIKLTLNKNGDRVLGFTVSDKDCESYCTAADPTAIPPVTKDLTDKHTYNAEISLTEEFVDKFLKAKAALDEVEEFTIKMNKNDQIEFVLGFSVANTNRISILAPAIKGKDKFDGQPIRFLAKNFVEVLKANKEFTDGILYLKSEGIFKVIYKNDQFQCLYWQFAQIKK